MLANALGALTRWLPGEHAVDPALPLSAALPALAEATEQRRHWQDCTAGDGAAFGFRVEPLVTDDRVRLRCCVVPEEAHALRLVLAGDRKRSAHRLACGVHGLVGITAHDITSRLELCFIWLDRAGGASSRAGRLSAAHCPRPSPLLRSAP